MARLKDHVLNLIHETNAPLGTIKNYISLVKSNIDNKETVIKYLGIINDAINREIKAIDNLYKELENSKLWLEELL